MGTEMVEPGQFSLDQPCVGIGLPYMAAPVAPPGEKYRTQN